MTAASDRAWCRELFAGLRVGGVWAVPRSGLVFRRDAGELVLVDRMPWTDELQEAAAVGLDVPKSEQELSAYQDLDYRLIRDRFAGAGIRVRDGRAR